MEKLTWTWKKIVTLICGFWGIGTLVSCYGMPVARNFHILSGEVQGDIDGDGNSEAVPGIKVSVFSDSELLGETYTEEDGSFYLQTGGGFNYVSSLLIKCEDVDGKSNGAFKPYNGNYSHDVITLERADSSEEN